MRLSSAVYSMSQDLRHIASPFNLAGHCVKPSPLELKIRTKSWDRFCALYLHIPDMLSYHKHRRFFSIHVKAQRKAQLLNIAIARIRRRLLYPQSEFHRKAAAFFTHHFDVIIIPPFEVANVINRKIKKIQCQTVRSMISWAHYRSRQRLISKVEVLSVRVIIQNEPIHRKRAVGARTFRQ